MGLEPGAERALATEEQDEDHPGDHGGDREGEVDQGGERALAGEVELGDAPGGGEAEDEVQGDGDPRGEEGELERGEGHRLPDGVEVGPPALREGLREDRREGNGEEEEEEGEGGRGQDEAHRERLGEAAGRRAAAVDGGGAPVIPTPR